MACFRLLHDDDDDDVYAIDVDENMFIQDTHANDPWQNKHSPANTS